MFIQRWEPGNAKRFCLRCTILGQGGSSIPGDCPSVQWLTGRLRMMSKPLQFPPPEHGEVQSLNPSIPNRIDTQRLTLIHRITCSSSNSCDPNSRSACTPAAVPSPPIPSDPSLRYIPQSFGLQNRRGGYKCCLVGLIPDTGAEEEAAADEEMGDKGYHQGDNDGGVCRQLTQWRIYLCDGTEEPRREWEGWR